MTQRNFNNTTTTGALSAALASSAVSIAVSGFSQTPAIPFTVTIDRNTATEEVCLVTASAGGTLTLTRGYDGTVAQAHAAGATIEHTAGAIEYTEANLHNNATSNVHGATGSLVGNQGAQTVYDKTLVSPVLQADVTKGDAAVAVIPTGATVRNLFRGVGADGNNKIVVDSSGNLTAAGVALTALNTTVSGHTTQIGTANTNIASNTTAISNLTTNKADKSYTDTQDTATLTAAKAYTDAGVGSLGTRIYFAAYPTTAQSIADNATVTVAWGTEIADTANAHAANAASFVAPQTGYYRALASVAFKTNSNGLRYAYFQVNGSNVQGSGDVQLSGSALQNIICKPERRVFMNSGDALTVVAGIQSVGGALSIQEGAGALGSVFEVTWDGA